MTREFFTSKDGALWVQPGGPNTQPYYLGCHDPADISEPGSGIGELIRCFDQNTGGWKVIGQTKSPPDMVTTSVETVMGKAADWLEKAKCPMSIYVNVRDCGRADTFDNFVRSFVLRNAAVSNRGVSELVHREDDNAVTMSFEISAIPPLLRVFEMSIGLVTTSDDPSLNDVAFTTDIRCAGACGAYQEAGKTGYAVGDALGGATVNVLKSTDGGETWAATSTDPFSGAEDISSVVLFYMGRDTLRVLVARGTADAGAPAEVAYSDNGGTTWTLANVGSTNGHYATRGGSLFAVDQYNIWFAATDGYIYKSEDGGVTWAAKQSGVLTTGDYNAIHFSSEKVGFAGAAADVIVRTTNGGDTWTACTATGGGGDILTVWALDEYRVWVGTDDGDIYYSVDGGATWNERTVTGITAGTIADIQFSNDQIGYLIHNTTAPVGRVYRTINGGYSWQAHDLVTNAGLSALSMVDTNHMSVVSKKSYLLRDTFSGDRAAGAVNGTAAEPGPGTRTVVDTENKLSVAGGVLSFAGGKAAPAYDNPGISYALVNRASGRLLLSRINVVAGTTQFRIGFSYAAGIGACDRQAFLVAPTALSAIFNSTTIVTCGALVAGTNYDLCVVIRGSGAFYFVKGGTFLNWSLVYVESLNSGSALYPSISNRNAVFTADNVRIPAQLWLPVPLASDAFTRANGALGSTDGLGHAEQNGGNGLAWTFDSGVWTVAGNAAVGTPTLGGELDSGNLVVGNWYSITLDTVGSYFYAGSATGKSFRATATTALTALEKVKQITLSSLFASVSVSTPDVLAEAAVTMTAGTQAGLVLNLDSAATPANFVIAYHDGTNCLLGKCVAGTYTSVISAAATYSAGAVLRVIKNGTAYRLYYNNALVGTGTISDAGIVSNARHGLFSTYASNSFDNFVIFARGTGNEYSALDSF